jgi:hypothetical protein
MAAAVSSVGSRCPGTCWHSLGVKSQPTHYRQIEVTIQSSNTRGEERRRRKRMRAEREAEAERQRRRGRGTWNVNLD